MKSSSFIPSLKSGHDSYVWGFQGGGGILACIMSYDKSKFNPLLSISGARIIFSRFSSRRGY